MPRQRKLKKSKKKLSRKEIIVLAATITVPILIIIAFNVALVVQQKPLADQPLKEFTLYFYNQQQNCLSAQPRQVVAHKDLDSQIRELFDQLLEGPSLMLASTMHDRTRILQLELDERRLLHLTLNKFYLKSPLGTNVPPLFREASLINTITSNFPDRVAGIILDVEVDPPYTAGSPDNPLTVNLDAVCR